MRRIKAYLISFLTLTLMSSSSLLGYENYMPSELIVPFTLSKDLMLIDAIVDGKAGQFIFDTGADHIVLHNNLKNNLSSVTISTLTGETEAISTKISQMKIGSWKLFDLDVISKDLTNLQEHTNSSSLLGIIGISLFTNSEIEIDQENKTIKIKSITSSNNSKSKASQKQIPIQNKDGLIFIEAEISGETYSFLLDSGASISILDETIKNKLFDQLYEYKSQIELITAEGSANQTEVIKLNELKVEGFNFKEMPFAIINLDAHKALFGNNFGGIISLKQIPHKSLKIDLSNHSICFAF